MTAVWTGWWRAPLWALQLATGAKSFVDNPIIGSPALNRRGLHVARLKVAHALAWSRRRRLARLVPVELRKQFDWQGFLCLPDFLEADEFARLQMELLGKPLPTREHRQGDTITRRVAIGPEMSGKGTALAALLRSSRWKGLMRYIASTGGEPLYYVQSIITGLDGPPDPQLNLHYDSFQPALKAWLFMDDVSDDEGPLTYVAGSHRLTSARLDWERRRSLSLGREGDRLSQRGSLRIEAEELARLGLPPPTRFAVSANTLVLIDTCGFHARARSEKPSVRVELWAYRRRSPFLPWTGFNLLSMPGLALHRAEWAYRLTDWLAARGWRQQYWRSIGFRRATDR